MNKENKNILTIFKSQISTHFLSLCLTYKEQQYSANPLFKGFPTLYFIKEYLQKWEFPFLFN